MKQLTLAIILLSSLCIGGHLSAQAAGDASRKHLTPLAAAKLARVEDSIKAVQAAQEKAQNFEDSVSYSYLHQGDLYYYGEQVERNYAEAVKWYRKAADRGLAYAQYKLGTCYYYGLGVTRNPQEAKKWFQQAADQGHVDANRFLTIPGR